MAGLTTRAPPHAANRAWVRPVRLFPERPPIDAGATREVILIARRTRYPVLRRYAETQSPRAGGVC